MIPDPERTLMAIVARASFNAVIEHLITKAQQLPHHRACLAPKGQPCLCFTDQVVTWLREQKA